MSAVVDVYVFGWVAVFFAVVLVLVRADIENDCDGQWSPGCLLKIRNVVAVGVFSLAWPAVAVALLAAWILEE